MAITMVSYKGKYTGPILLGILCFQGFGLRIFQGVIDGAILIWFVLLTIINWHFVKKVSARYWFKIILTILFYISFSIIKKTEILPYLIVAWLSAAVVLTRYYYNNEFIEDLRKLVKFCMYYDLLHIPIMLFLRPLLVETNLGMKPMTFLYLFWFNNLGIYEGRLRIQGFCWEPSCWILLLCINFLLVLYYKENKMVLILSAIAIISSFSTTGMVTMLIVLLLYYMTNINRKKMLKTIFFLLLFSISVFPIIYNDFNTKMQDTSGQARGGDFLIAAAVMAHNPFMGADVENITELSYAMEARENFWTSNGDFKGYMEEGMVNSFAALLVEWGIPITFLIFYLMFKSPLFIENKLRILFLLTLLLVIIGTPIARTGFFYMFSLSSLLFFSPVKKIKKTYIP